MPPEGQDDKGKGGDDKGKGRVRKDVPIPGTPEYMEHQDELDAERRKRLAAKNSGMKPHTDTKDAGGGEDDKDKGKGKGDGKDAGKAGGEDKGKGGDDKGKGEDAKDISIPKSRFDQVLNENRGLRDEINQLKGAISTLQKGGGEPAKKDKFNFAKAQAAKLEAAKAGEWDKYAQLEALIDEERDKEWQAKLDASTDDVMQSANANAQVQVGVQAVLAQYPKLERTHPEFNAEALDFVSRQARYAMIAGEEDASVNVVDELKKIAAAADAQFKLSEPKSTEDELIDSITGGKKTTGMTAAEIAAQQAKDKNDVAKKQPPNVTRLGEGGEDAKNNLTVTDIQSMSQRDFEEMTPEEKARLRGDFVDDQAA